MKLKILSLVFFLLPAFLVIGQEGKKWDLQKCIEYALENNIQVKQGDLNRIQGEITLKNAKMSRLPTLNGSVSYNYSTGRSIDPFTNTIENQDIQSQRYGLNTSVTLFNYSAINNSIKKGVVDLEINEYDLESIKNNTILNVITFYTNVLLNDEQVKNAEFNLETTVLRLDQTEKQFEAGSLNKQSLLQIRQQLAVDELTLVRAENAYQLSVLNLQQVMQLPVTADFEVINPVLGEPNVNILIDATSVIYDQAVNLQPDVKSAEAGVESSRLAVKISEANLYPTLTLSGGLGTSYSSVAPDTIPADGAENISGLRPIGFVEGTTNRVLVPTSTAEEYQDLTYIKQLDFNQNSFIGVSLNIPIFNGGNARNGLQVARINQQRAELNETNIKNQLRQNIEQAYQNVLAAVKSYESSKNQVEALDESFKNVDQRFGLGAANSIEYNQIKNDLSRAQSDLIRNKYDYIFKLKILDFYQGKPLSF